MDTRPSFKKYKSPYESILIIKCNGVSDFRVLLAAKALEAAGYHTEIISEVPYYKASQHDIFLSSRPSDEMVDFLNICLRAGKKVIIDMDDDFYSIPMRNPAYPYIGAGHATYHINLKEIMPKVNRVYASAELQNRYHLPGTIIPNTWDDNNTFWRMPKIRDDKIRLGFTGTNTHREDFRLISKMMHWLLKERQDIKLVIGNDDSVYNEFSEIPIEQKYYLPPLTYKDYPLSYLYMDILLVPLVDNHFNRAKSDIKLVEAGASRTPWLASNLPMYEQWGVGGKLINNVDDWAKEIIALANNPMQRESYGNAGYKMALERTETAVGKMWLNLIENLGKP